MEIDQRCREGIRQREEEERRHKREKEDYENKYAAWKTQFMAYDIRKQDEWEEKHAECKLYGSATDEDSDSTKNEMKYDVEEINTSEMDSDEAEEKDMMERWHERKLRMRVEFEMANPMIYACTMQEGECSRSKEETQEKDSEEESEERDSEDDEDASSSINTSHASSESADKWFREEEYWDSDEGESDDDY
ncbi:glutamic acid-rich protein-like [Papaver somniferum]|uniref:glutamic acid-rich protein-like n=1 Tax=Papaver somniferum TaxID=3469 RepID=UPI000E6FEBE0|nr:glutamic acid-rich protein-like [Papaver somniferum]XP_026445452.1 glutamic acid-rich protein-like [Papaver somniferum]